jgi:ATP-dependent protease HslVU (ClpYQ) peptidase subunit
MTCTIGVVHDGHVYIGADSSANGPRGALQVRSDSKVIKSGEFVLGFAGSFRVGQIIRYSLSIPRVGGYDPDTGTPLDADLYRYMVTKFIPALKECLKGAGVALNEDGQDGIPAKLLVGVRGRLFEVDADYQVAEPVDDFAAIGIGMPIAQGALYVTEGIEPFQRINQALRAAERHSAYVRGPFVVVSTRAN